MRLPTWGIRHNALNRPQLATAMAALAIVSAVGVTGIALTTPVAAAVPLTSYVNPFIGTQDDGNNFPGASAPFGMVQISPDTGHSVGYDYGGAYVRGFSLMHLSGVGCPLGGMVPISATTGDMSSTDYGVYAQKISKDGSTKVESASPGYYSVGLDSAAGRVTAELTATTRTGVQRYTFPATSKANILINAGQSLNSTHHSKVAIVDSKTVRVATTISGFCESTERFTVYSTTRFNRPFASSATWTGNTYNWGSTSADSDSRTGALLRFDASGSDRVVEAQTSLSYVDAQGADNNLSAEQVGFDQARTALQNIWEDRLQTVKVQTGDTERLRPFYSALYRMHLAPNVGSDVDGRYRGFGTSQQTKQASGFTYYQNFSLWDTYRTQQQALALFAPEESADMAYSLVRQAVDGGALPTWSYGPVETNVMCGDPATVFIVSAWSQGLLEGHESEAYQVMKRNADTLPGANTPYNGRVGLEGYIADGFIPFDATDDSKPGDSAVQRAGSATLEYAVADAGLSTMATALAQTETDPAVRAVYLADAQRYAERGQNYRNVWDPASASFRSRGEDGVFIDDTDPAWGSGWQEGSAVQYEWMVQQDVPGLIDLMGGKAAAEARLDSFFAYYDVVRDPARTAREVWVNNTYDYSGQDRYNPNNETDLQAPHMYLWTGQPWKTTDVLRAALTLFTDGPTGVTGNDDLGQMSSWAVMNSIGLYPLIPGSDVWGLSTPMFERVEIALDEDYYPASNGLLTLTANGVSDSSHYTQSLTVGGQGLDRGYLSGDELTAARTLDFTVGSSISSWATGTNAAPAALTGTSPAQDITDRVWASADNQVAVHAGEARTVTVKVVARALGDSSGRLEATAEAGVPVTVTAPASWSASSRNSAVQIQPRITIAVEAGTRTGTYPVTLKVIRTGGETVTRRIDVVVPQESWLEGDFNHTAIGDHLSKNADMDGGGNHYDRKMMTDAGLLAGARVTVPGRSHLSYVMGGGQPGPDNVFGHGQTLDVRTHLGAAQEIALIAAATGGSTSATLRLNYASGNSSDVTLSLPDWTDAAPGNGATIIGRRTERSNGRRETSIIGVAIFALPSVTIPSGEHLVSITLPNNQHVHVFAIASDSEPARPHALTLPSITGTPSVGNVLTASDASWDVAASTDLQWAVNGRNVPGATGNSYLVRKDDAGGVITVTSTAVAPGLVADWATSAPVRVPAVGPEVPVTPQRRIDVITAPRLMGKAVVGATLAASAGTFTPVNAAVRVAWLRDGKVIAKATSYTYTITPADLGARLSLRVTATLVGRTTKVVTTSPVQVESGRFSAGTVRIRGKAKVGKKLKANRPSASIPGVSYRYQWYRNKKAIAGAKKATYRLRNKDRKKRISVRVTVSRIGYAAVRVSSPATTRVR